MTTYSLAASLKLKLPGELYPSLLAYSPVLATLAQLHSPCTGTEAKVDCCAIMVVAYRSLQVWRPRGGYASGNKVDKTERNTHSVYYQ